VESMMNTNTISLLSLTPGIIRKRSGVVRSIINPSDWVKMLTMQDPMRVVNEDQWVQVLKGTYKGDFGLVTRVESWGAQVLLVPRLKAPKLQDDTSLKRKRTTIKPEPRLFDPIIFKSMFHTDLRRRSDGTYTSRGLVFDHGLLRKDFDLHSLSPVLAGIPSRMVSLFWQSAHPAIVASSSLPCPQEWIFEESEKIVIRSSKRKATITAVRATHLEVDLASKEGIEAVSWHDIRKVFTIGDFVNVTSGPSQGTTGWIERVEDDVAYVLELQEKGKDSSPGGEIKVIFRLGTS
jgi:ribosomal protein L24